MVELDVATLMGIMRECAGESPDLARAEVSADQDVEDLSFTELGYDSLALLETASRIERDYGVRLAEDRVTDATTPRELLSMVNAAVADVA
jgi:act minimal PKS acyl carrier protein